MFGDNYKTYGKEVRRAAEWAQKQREKQMPKILTDDEAEEEFGHLVDRTAEEMRKQDEAAFQRLREYIREHQGNMLALDIANLLWRNH
jgi:hypothetical protein